MQIVIEIPEHDKNVIERFVRGDGCEDMPPSIIENLIRAVYLGTPLPNGHGRLIDVDELIRQYKLDEATKYGNKNAKQQAYSYSTMMLYEIADMIDDAPTIIEADKGDKE